MLGYLADKALIYGRIWSVSQCLSLCLGSMATGPCCQHIQGLLTIRTFKFSQEKNETNRFDFIF